MKRTTMAAIVTLAVLLVAGAASSFAQSTFKVPFPFQAGGGKLPAGEYVVVSNTDGGLTLKQESTGKLFPLAFTERLAQPAPPLADPQLVFDEVGDFAPSYTEYITVYILSEVWLARGDGFRTHTTKGGHKTKVVKGEAAKK
jgi:hypothetical protein